MDAEYPHNGIPLGGKMKKFVSLLICVLLFAGVLAMAVSAQDDLIVVGYAIFRVI